MNAPATQLQTRPSLIAKLGAKYSVDPDKMLATLKATAFAGEKEVSNEQMMALLVVADQYNLNPWTKEIYAFPTDPKKGGIVPIVGIDGWIRMVNERAELVSIEFNYPETENDEVPAWIECVITRKDRATPIAAREYYAECKRNTGPWNSHPRRMLRHKAFIQAARIAFGFGGIYDPDEGARVAEAINVTPPRSTKPPTRKPKAIESTTPTLATSDQLEHVRELMAKCDVTDDVVFERFKISALEELQFEQVPHCIAFIQGTNSD